MEDVTELFCDPNLGSNDPEDSRQNWTAQLLQAVDILVNTEFQGVALASFILWFSPLHSLSCCSATDKSRMRNPQVRQEWGTAPGQHRDPSDICTPDPRSSCINLALENSTRSHLGTTLSICFNIPPLSYLLRPRNLFVSTWRQRNRGVVKGEKDALGPSVK